MDAYYEPEADARAHPRGVEARRGRVPILLILAQCRDALAAPERQRIAACVLLGETVRARAA